MYSHGLIFFKEAIIIPSPAFQTEGKLYLVLEFLRGGDLFTRLSKEVRDCLCSGCFRSKLFAERGFVPPLLSARSRFE